MYTHSLASSKPSIYIYTYTNIYTNPFFLDLYRLPETLIYADDTDFLSLRQKYLDHDGVPLFKDEYKLIVNVDREKQSWSS